MPVSYSICAKDTYQRYKLRLGKAKLGGVRSQIVELLNSSYIKIIL